MMIEMITIFSSSLYNSDEMIFQGLAICYDTREKFPLALTTVVGKGFLR